MIPTPEQTIRNLQEILAIVDRMNMGQQSPINETNPLGYVIWTGGPASYEDQNFALCVEKAHAALVKGKADAP